MKTMRDAVEIEDFAPISLTNNLHKKLKFLLQLDAWIQVCVKHAKWGILLIQRWSDHSQLGTTWTICRVFDWRRCWVLVWISSHQLKNFWISVGTKRRYKPACKNNISEPVLPDKCRIFNRFKIWVSYQLTQPCSSNWHSKWLLIVRLKVPRGGWYSIPSGVIKNPHLWGFFL